MPQLQEIDVQLTQRKNRPTWQIVGWETDHTGRRSRVRKTTGTVIKSQAQVFLSDWIKTRQAEMVEERENAEKVEGVRASAGTKGDLAKQTVTIYDAATEYKRQRVSAGNPVGSKNAAELKYLDNLVSAHGDELIYEVTPQIALLWSRELFAGLSKSTQKRYGTQTFAGLYNTMAAMYAGWEYKKWKHDTIPSVRRQAATADWVKNFLAILETWQPTAHAGYNDPTLRMQISACVRFLFTTGSRISETAKLTWGDISLIDRTVHMKGETRKNGDDVVKVLTDSMVEDFEALANSKYRLKTDPVFEWIANSAPCQTFNSRIKTICSIYLEPMTSHAIGSHGAISTLLEAGYTPRVISEITGKAEETIKHYGKTTMGARAAIANSVFG